MSYIIFDDIILRAEQYFGDIMGEFAEIHYSDNGGALGLVEGSAELSDDDIKYCMGDALIQVFGYNSTIDLEPIIEYWFKRDY